MEISGWILSIAGICLLSVVIDLILPDGSINSHIKRVFSYIIVLAILMPLTNLVKGGINFEDVFSEVEITVQDDFIYNINQAKVDSWIDEIEVRLKDKKIIGATISISANIFDRDMKIDAVYVDLYNAVINSNDKNIDIKAEVKSVVMSIINIKEDKIIFNE